MNAAHDILPAVEWFDNEDEEDAMNCEWDSDSIESISETSEYPRPFCHNNFINYKENIESIEMCLGTDKEPDVLKSIHSYCPKIFEATDEIEEHIGIH